MARRYPGSVGTRNRMVQLLIACALLWSGYVVFFVGGRFSPPHDMNQAMNRIGNGFSSTADSVETEIQETNDNMHQVVRDREKLNKRRIKRDTKAK